MGKPALGFEVMDSLPPDVEVSDSVSIASASRGTSPSSVTSDMAARRVSLTIQGVEHSWSLEEAKAIAARIRQTLSAEARQEAREHLERAGLCRRCRVRPLAEHSRSRCAACLDYAVRWAQKRRDSR
jgi:hypothetical protein